MNGHTEPFNRTLTQLHFVMIQKNTNSREDSLPIIEFAHNRCSHSITGSSPFPVIYGFNPLTSLDLLPLPCDARANQEGETKQRGS